MLSREKAAFSDTFYRRHRQHVILVLAKVAIVLALGGALAGTCAVFYFRRNGEAALLGIAVVVVMFLAWAAWRGTRDVLRVRVLPYFDRPLGQKDTWLAGENLLRHSRQLDEIAARLGVRPLSDFASGDDLIRGETLQWFAPGEALKTIDCLLRTDTQASLPPAVVSDLKRVRDALHSASSQSAKFCFLLREGSSISGLESGRRKGSFF